VGCLAGVLSGGRLVQQVLFVGILIALLIVASVTAYRTNQYLFDPLVPALALVVAAQLSAVVHRFGLRWTLSQRRLEE